MQLDPWWEVAGAVSFEEAALEKILDQRSEIAGLQQLRQVLGRKRGSSYGS